MFYRRCVAQQKECRLSFLFRKCSKCIYFDRKCEFAKLVINFDVIEKAMIKLKEEELRIKIAQIIIAKQFKIFQVRLQRLCKQKRFLRDKEQKLFDKNLFNVKKLKRLKNLKRITKMKKILFFINSFANLFEILNFFTLF